ncbi:MAG TPA: proton-conducting membrane transporter [Firmicutes bacterium]|jgi:NADH:ubiquinone oxidoreductase subunit 5 (subunit L)/multisubunit Na+/H+ antiporter MnhA subunit|nr:proton-conducting membrane transporter [Bacillota bacterium]
MSILLLLILIPALYGAILLAFPANVKSFWEVINVAISAFLGYLVLLIWGPPQPISFIRAWAGFGMDFQLRFGQFNQFFIAAICGAVFLIVLYSFTFMLKHPRNNQFYGFLFLTEAMAIGAVLANNLVIMLFFWEAMLITLFAMINSGNGGSYKTAVKAFVIVGLADLCLMFGIGIVEAQAKTTVMTDIHLETTGAGAVAFVLMFIGAMAKAGAIPFHNWIPEASKDAPLPFMVLLPAALGKLLGIYLATRIVLEFFTVSIGMKLFVMSIGAITIVVAAMMALIQTDFKRALSYCTISQVGYMLLGIGTGIPIAIAGGLFQMINQVICECCLFFVGGSVEKQTGTTDLKRLGGLWKDMPLTFLCFAISGAAVSGVPLFGGFISKQMIFDGVLQTNYRIFFLAAVLGALFTAITFLKLGHAIFFGKTVSNQNEIKDAHWSMLTPMTLLALGTIFFGVDHSFPFDYLIKPSLGEGLREAVMDIHYVFSLSQLVWFTFFTLAVAVIDHAIGVRLSGNSIGSSDHIRNAPVLKSVYGLAERQIFDPYVQGKAVGRYAALGLYWIDRGINWIYQSLIPAVADFISQARRFHNGLYANYLAWSLGGFLCLLIYFVGYFK